MGDLIQLPRKMPKQRPGESKQDYGTPKAFIDAVKKRFGITSFNFDLAATKDNAVDGLGRSHLYFGPDHRDSNSRDALSADWRPLRGNLWLNPPFARIEPWARKCAEESKKIFFLTPASVGANWFWAHVYGRALVMPIHPRLEFDGCPINPKTDKVDPYPKDLMLSIFGVKHSGLERFEWKKV
jgi:hypothetical protein